MTENIFLLFFDNLCRCWCCETDPSQKFCEREGKNWNWVVCGTIESEGRLEGHCGLQKRFISIHATLSDRVFDIKHQKKYPSSVILYFSANYGALEIFRLLSFHPFTRLLISDCGLMLFLSHYVLSRDITICGKMKSTQIHMSCFFSFLLSSPPSAKGTVAVKHFITGKKKNIFKEPNEEFSSTLAFAQSRKSIKFSIVITPWDEIQFDLKAFFIRLSSFFLKK